MGADIPNAEDRLDTRVFLGLATFPLSFFTECRGERREMTSGLTDCRTEAAAAYVGEDAAAAATGAGVGGSSASICSTSHDRFSSKNFSRSA